MVVGARPGAPGESRFVGRHTEAALVSVTIDQTSTGAPTALVVRGEPGIGKTRLLGEAVARARARGHHVVWVRADPIEARVPFGALSVALDHAAASDPAFGPSAAAVHAFVSGTEADPSSRLSFAQVCDTFARSLVDTAEHEPACVVVDDVHHLDHESLAFLGVALGRVAGRNVSFVCSTRSPGRDLDSHAAELLARVAEWPDVEELDLAPLGEDEVRELLEDAFGKPVSRSVADTVAERSGGNPLFVLELARSLSELGLLDTGESRVGLLEGPGALHLSRHTAVLQRLFPLTADCRRVAQVVAVLHRIRLTDLDLVGELAQLDAADLAQAFDELERRGIVVVDTDGTWSLFHPFVTDALYDDIGPAERRRLHRRVADHLLSQRDQGGAVDLMLLAWHVSTSADVGDVDAARVLGEAAESIRNAGPLSAADLCQQALSLLPDGSPERADLLSLRTRCLILAGRPHDAVETGRAALDVLTVSSPERTRTATAVIGALFDVGNVEAARRLAEREAAVGPASPFVLAQRAMMIAAEGDVESTGAAVDDALALPRRSASEEVLVRSFLTGATMLVGDIAGGLDHLEHVRQAAGEAATNLRVYGLSRRAWSLVVAGFVTDAVAAVEDAEAALGAVGQGTYSAGVATARIGIDWMTGGWDHALAALVDVRRDVELAQNAVIREYLSTIEIDIRTIRGELREALAQVTLPSPHLSATRWAWVTAGTLRATGDAAGARQILRSALDHPRDLAWRPHVLLRLLELEHETGNGDEARAALHELQGGEVDPRPWVQALVLRGRAVVDGDARLAVESAAVAEAEGLAYDAALARLLAGALDRADAEQLLAAHEAFGALGAEADRRRAGALLRDRGAKVPRRRRRSPGELTGPEVEIARLVQAGLRNRDIARTTNYSERTVEVYLSRIYGKLGVSSRLQLARLLDEQGL
jgi:ATP/maltotriose-dependent transcriptional regulator MalT